MAFNVDDILAAIIVKYLCFVFVFAYSIMQTVNLHFISHNELVAKLFDRNLAPLTEGTL